MSQEDVRDIYKLLRDIKCDIAGINVKCPEHSKQIEAINARVIQCEAVINRATGMYTIIGFVAGIVGSFVVGIAVHFLTRK
jgi:hypothetical protein